MIHSPPPSYPIFSQTPLLPLHPFPSQKKPLNQSHQSFPLQQLSLTKIKITQPTLTPPSSLPKKIKRPKSTRQKKYQKNHTINIHRIINDKTQYFNEYLSDISLLNNYKILSHIGKGCFSIVSLAIHKHSNKKYALKVYQRIDSLQWHRLQCIKKQIKHLKKLSHQNIIQLFHVMKDKKKLLLLMDNGGKQTISGLLRKHSFFNQNNAKFYFKQVVKAVSYCHSKGICHRDLKPENILVDDNGNVKIIDFGFSENSAHMLTTYCGTPPFMSPQITKKIPYNGALADVWALGVILYLLIVGTLPFRATNEAQLNRLIQQGKFPKKNQMTKKLKNILSKLLHCDISKRISSEKILSDPWLIDAVLPDTYN